MRFRRRRLDRADAAHAVTWPYDVPPALPGPERRLDVHLVAGGGPPSAVRLIVSGTASMRSSPSAATTVRQRRRSRRVAERNAGAVAGAAIRAHTLRPAVDLGDAPALPHDAREHAVKASRLGPVYSDPLEIRLEQDVLADVRDGGVREVEQHRVADEPRAFALGNRRDEEQQLVDEPGLEERRRERGAALEQERLDSLGRQRTKPVLERPLRSSSSEPAGSGPLPNASRRGWRTASTSRAFNLGASARTVPMPTATASDAARSSCTRRRDASPETQRRPGSETRPSSVTAALYVTNGRPSAFHVRHASFWRRASSLSSSSTAIPAARSRSRPPAATGFGSRAPTTTRAMPAATTASAHGGVRP